MLLGGRGGKNRIGAAVALAAVLVMVLAAPAGASGWGWGEEKIWSGGFFHHVLAWLGLAPSHDVNTKDQGASIDPNGSPVSHKSLSKQGSSIDPNGDTSTASRVSGEILKQGSQIDPNGRF